MNEAKTLPFPIESSSERPATLEQVRQLEAILFAAKEPVPQKVLVESMPDGCDIQTAIQRRTLT